MSSPSTRGVMTRGLTLIFALAGGAAVGNLYWSQPLLDFIAEDLHSSPATAGWLVTATQLGYALGVFLIVPLGDRLDRRRLVPAMLLLSALALLASAAAPTMALLLVALTLVGLTTVAGQILTPLAGDLADDSNRGRVVGTVVSGLIIGILVSRTLSGLVAGFLGWRAIYLVAAILAVLLAVLLFRKIPALEANTSVRYRTLLKSVFTVIARERVVRWTLVLGATSFGVFTMFWTALTFLLSAPPFSFSVTIIGLFGLAGLAGAAVAQRVGWFHDRGWSIRGTGVAWTIILLSFVVADLGAGSVVVLIVAIILLDAGGQAQNVLAQTRLFAVSASERSRLNTAFVTCNFIGGAIGSALAGGLWALGGWAAVCLAGAVLAGFGFTVWLVGRRGALQRTTQGSP
jgi:predicted MFS family arabinose efflux permease